MFARYLSVISQSFFLHFVYLNTGYLVQVSRVTPSKITWHLSSDGYAPDLSTFKSTLTMIKIFYWFTIIYCFNDATAALCKYTSSFITQFTRDWTFNVYSWLTLFSWNICFSFSLCYLYVEKRKQFWIKLFSIFFACLKAQIFTYLIRKLKCLYWLEYWEFTMQ